MNKKGLKEFIQNYWEDVADDIEEMMIAGLSNSVGTGDICVSAEIVSKIARQGIMRLIDQYELTLPLVKDNQPSEGKYLYILYDWRNEEIIYKTRSQLQMYAKVGKMQLDGVYEEDMHVITVNLEEVENDGRRVNQNV